MINTQFESYFNKNFKYGQIADNIKRVRAFNYSERREELQSLQNQMDNSITIENFNKVSFINTKKNEEMVKEQDDTFL